MKFIHCADIHLGSPLDSRFDKKTASERRDDLTLTFGRLVQYARENAVRAVIIAGDLFDCKKISRSLYETVIGFFADAPDVDFLYLKGNHDEDAGLGDGLPLPPNLKFFGESWTRFDYGEITVAGVCLTPENCSSIYETLTLEPGRLNIAVLHGQISRTARKETAETVLLRRLAGKYIDYLAMGHLHSYQKEQLDTRGETCYSGCLEGRGFDEPGECGFVLLDCNKGKVESAFVPFASRTVHIVEADITGLSSATLIAKEADAALTGIPDRDMVRLILKGTTLPDTFKNLPFLSRRLKERFYYAEIKDESRLKIDPAAYADGVSLKSEFIRLVLGENLDEEQKDKIIALGLAALAGEEPVV